MEFINLNQGVVSVKKYSLQFTQHFKFALTMVAKYRARMNKFIKRVSSFVEEDCRTKMLLNDMYTSRIMVYAQQIDESKLRMMNRDSKRPR